jgi:hypothetical protein
MCELDDEVSTADRHTPHRVGLERQLVVVLGVQAVPRRSSAAGRILLEASESIAEFRHPY